VNMTQFSVGSITVIAESYDKVGKKLMLSAPVSKLTTPLVAGSVLTKKKFITTLQAPANNWFTLQFGGFAYLTTDLAIRSNVAATPNGTANFDGNGVAGSAESLILEISFSSLLS